MAGHSVYESVGWTEYHSGYLKVGWWVAERVLLLVELKGSW